MSDEKPFAEYDSYWDRTIVAGIDATKGVDQDNVRIINSSVAARERKAAAKALREAIESLQSGWKVNEVVGASAAVERLRARLAALEGGAT